MLTIVAFLWDWEPAVPHAHEPLTLTPVDGQTTLRAEES